MELLQDGVVAALAAIGVTALIWLAASLLLWHERPVDAVFLVLKKLNDFLAGLPMTIVAGAFLLGPRLPEAELTKVWTGFYQSGEKRKNGSTEIGMGLYIVKDIMNHHQGSCGALNREAGVEFWMCFPKNPVV